MPSPVVATVFKVGGRQASLRGPMLSMASTSCSTRSAPGRSALLITNTSAISITPALKV